MLFVWSLISDDLFLAGDDGIEPMIVTEIPEAMFRKPKVRDYSCRTEKKLLKPSFPNRREARSSQGK